MALLYHIIPRFSSGFTITILLLTLFLSGCMENTEKPNVSSDGKPDNTSNTSEVFNMEKIEFVEIEWAGVEWDEIEFPIDPKEVEIPTDVKSISTKEDAISIGEVIIKNCWSNNKFLSYVLLTVVHSTEDNIWRFDYSIDQRDKAVGDLIDCGGFYVAIDGNNCEIIKAWVDE